MVSSYLFGLFSTGNYFRFSLVNIPFLIYFIANSCYREMAVV